MYVVNELNVSKIVGCHVVDDWDKTKEVGHHVVNWEFGLLVCHLLTFILGASKAVEYLASLSWVIHKYFQSLSKR
jgi:hypothetical protein